MELVLRRDDTDGKCQLGVLTVGVARFQTIELPWIPAPSAPCGTKGVSCIPRGRYALMTHSSESHPRTWALVNPELWVYHWDEDVPAERTGRARTLCLIHIANWARELRGCIAPGQRRVREPVGRWMVQDSAVAMRRIQAVVPWNNEHTLEIM